MKHAERGDDETTRSGLFFEAIRIIKEMRNNDRANGRTGKLIRPRYAIYENVPGALTSPGGENKGADWQAVITELVRIAEPSAPDVPMPEAGWAYADCFYGMGEDGQPFSIAYRLTDAQYWGVAQRRARLCLLVDYAGFTAPWILFDPEFDFATENGEPLTAFGHTDERAGEVSALAEGLYGKSNESGEAWEGTSAGAESGVGEPGRCLNPWDIQSKHVQPEDGIAEPLYSGECRYGGGESYTLKIRGGVERDSNGRKAGKGALVQKEMSGTIGVSQDQTLIRTGINGDVAETLDAHYYLGCGSRGGKEREVVIDSLEDSIDVQKTAYGICSYESNAFKSSNPHSAIYKAETSRTLDNNGGSPACNQGGIAVVQTMPREGNGARPSHYGAGFGNPDDPSFTLNHVEQHGVAVTYDARGNGDGDISCTLTGDHQDRVTDYTALVVEKNETASAV